MDATNLTAEEMETLRKGARGAALLVTLSDRSFFDTFKEAGAMARHLAEARRGSQSPLVQELAEGAGTGFSMTERPDVIERETMQALADGGRILREKAPEAVDEYRQFVLDLAQSVAQAAGGGEEAEQATIRRIEEALAE